MVLLKLTCCSFVDNTQIEPAILRSLIQEIKVHPRLLRCLDWWWFRHSFCLSLCLLYWTMLALLIWKLLRLFKRCSGFAFTGCGVNVVWNVEDQCRIWLLLLIELVQLLASWDTTTTSHQLIEVTLILGSWWRFSELMRMRTESLLIEKFDPVFTGIRSPYLSILLLLSYPYTWLIILWILFWWMDVVVRVFPDMHLCFFIIIALSADWTCNHVVEKDLRLGVTVEDIWLVKDLVLCIEFKLLQLSSHHLLLHQLVVWLTLKNSCLLKLCHHSIEIFLWVRVWAKFLHTLRCLDHTSERLFTNSHFIFDCMTHERRPRIWFVVQHAGENLSSIELIKHHITCMLVKRLSFHLRAWREIGSGKKHGIRGHIWILIEKHMVFLVIHVTILILIWVDLERFLHTSHHHALSAMSILLSLGPCIDYIILAHVVHDLISANIVTLIFMS